jgi:XisH protein
MPAKDIFHDTVKVALQKENWQVLRENFRVQVDDEGLALFIDLEAEKLISAEKDG